MNSSVLSPARPPVLHPGPDALPGPLRAKLLDRLPAACRVLVLGEADPSFATAYVRRHPGASVSRTDSAAADCDLVVLPDGLDRIEEDLLPLLKRLATQCPAAARLYIEFAGPHAVGPEADPVSSTDHAAQARRGSRAALCMVLMDAGWMPHAADYTIRPGTRQNIDGILVEATRPFDAAGPGLPPAASPANFAVVVPTTRPEELQLNVNDSPGLGEVRAPIYAIHEASSPADALDTALPHLSQDWVLLCHQDVYFPEGFGKRLSAELAAIPAAERDRTLIGFVGIAADAQQGGFGKAGFMIDRLNRMDHPASTTAVSIDEAALVLSRQSLHRIDPAMGWHLWATDLCLTSICQHEVFPRIVRLPLFHNSSNDSLLTDSFQASADRLLQKFPDFGPIPTLCGTLQAAGPTLAPVA
ncbi:MAG: hypothetical protein M3O01_07035, partial [Pseudomonadota bacterium]|nr:hypothetical protein [Pseudomonadota bacterium]